METMYSLAPTPTCARVPELFVRIFDHLSEKKYRFRVDPSYNVNMVQWVARAAALSSNVQEFTFIK